MGRGRHWGLEAEGGWLGLKNARLGSRREISREAGRSAAGGQGSYTEEGFTVRERCTYLYSPAWRRKYSDDARARQEVRRPCRASAERKRRPIPWEQS